MIGPAMQRMLSELSELDGDDTVLLVVPDTAGVSEATTRRQVARRLAQSGQAKLIYRCDDRDGAARQPRLCLAPANSTATGDAWRRDAPSYVEPPPLSADTLSVRLLATLTAELTGKRVPIKKAWKALQEQEQEPQSAAARM